MCQHKDNVKAPLVKRQASNGSWQIYKECPICGGNIDGSFIKKELVCGGWDKLPVARNAIEQIRCKRCNAPGAEVHHYMPQAEARQAGIDPNTYPADYLCDNCHQLWHLVVTPGLLAYKEAKDVLTNRTISAEEYEQKIKETVKRLRI